MEVSKLPIDVNSRILYSTARLTATRSNGVKVRGTGFFFVADTQFNAEWGVPLLITNRHVVDGASQIDFVLHLSDRGAEPRVPSGRLGKVTVLPSANQWLVHPEYDLAAISAQHLAPRDSPWFPYFVPFFEHQIISDAELSSLPPFGSVTMMGYPNGVIDEVHNLPIGRRGHTATHPNVAFNGRSEGLTNIANVGGSSGSPVTVMVPTARDGNATMELRLLGVHRGGFYISGTGKFEESMLAVEGVSTHEIRIPAHLGIYVQARELKWICREAERLALKDSGPPPPLS